MAGSGVSNGLSWRRASNFVVEIEEDIFAIPSGMEVSYPIKDDQ